MIKNKHILLKIGIFYFFLHFLNFHLYSQWQNISYTDSIYQENIHSVQFHLEGFPLTLPMVDIGSNASLELHFDDLTDDSKRYYYTVIHCNVDWTPSNLSTLEYINGFEENEITEVDFSFNTLTNFTHHSLFIPNDKLRWTRSGNYLLLIYDYDKNLVLTRRFMVVEPIVGIDAQVLRAASPSKFRTHQEIDFTVHHDRLEVKTPRNELFATVLQNGRWDNAIINVKPFFLRFNEAVFDYQDKIVFGAGKEYRYIDLTSLQYRSEGVAEIKEYKDVYEVTLFTDPLRFDISYNYIRDINGHFTIENRHRPNSYLEGDYAMVLFSLDTGTPFENANVYLVGKLTDWQLKKKYELFYSERAGAYLGEALLKQGYYNYAFAVVPNDTQIKDFSITEGNWYETENEYTILVYYRPFGERYDRLVGVTTFNSLKR